MEYTRDNIIEIKGLIWNVKDNYITFNHNNKKVILNETASMIWRMFDGINTINDVINKLYEDNKDQNTMEYIEEITFMCIDQFQEEGLIIIKENDDFGGWFNYE